MKKGNLVFVRSSGFISEVIRYFDPGPFNHVALAVSSNQIAEANVNIKSRIDPFNPGSYEYYEIIDLGLTDDQIERVMESSKYYLGRKYDDWQIAWYILKHFLKVKGRDKFNNPNNLICSEFVFDIFDKAGVLKDLGITGGSIDITPNQLYDLVNYVSMNCKNHQNTTENTRIYC